MRLNLKQEMGLYAGFMTEIKARSFVVELTLNAIRTAANPHSPLFIAEAEKAILQVRFMCELTALAAVAAHSRLGLTKDLLKSWNAGKTFKLLETVNPQCFPTAISLSPDGPNQIAFDRRKVKLDARGLERIYNGCGHLLHRGVIKHALENKPRVYDTDKIFTWTNEIIQLLDPHSILMPRHNAVLIVTLGNVEREVSVAYAEADGPFVVGPA